MRLQPRTLELNSLNTDKREAHIQDTESFQKEIKSLFCYHKTATVCLCDTKDLTAYRKSRMTTITYVTSEKKLKTYHANLLKKFEERQPLPPHDTILPHAAVSFIKEDNDESESNIEFLRVSQKEFPSDVRVDDKLSPNQQNEVTDLLQGFSETLSDLPGRTQCIEHKIRVVDDTPFRIRQYPLPVHLKKHLYRSQYCRYPTCPNRSLYSPTPQIKH